MIWKTDRLDILAKDCIEGMVRSRPDLWREAYSQKNAGVITKRKPTPEHFAVIVSGGGGNGPLFPGYVGEGLADAAVLGGPYSAPNAYAIYEAGMLLGRENGVLLLYNNFSGDYLNNDMAKELLEMEGIQVESVVSTDDIASALEEPREHRSGRSGIALLIKLAGACAKEGMHLSQAAELLRFANTRLGTLSLHVNEGQTHIAYGAGFSGEPPMRIETHMNMERAAKEVSEMLLEDLSPTKEETIFLLVNRLRLTSYSDGYIMANWVAREFSKHHLLQQLRVSAFSNIMDVYGFDFSVICMNGDIARRMDSVQFTDCFAI